MTAPTPPNPSADRPAGDATPGSTNPMTPDALADPPSSGVGAGQGAGPAAPVGPGGGVPAHDGGLLGGRYREVTIASIVFGVVVGAVMNAAITYAGLKIGFTIVGSAIAAVLGFGVLRGLLRRGTILETNIGQTIASAVNTPNSGVIFTVPVLYLLGYSLSPDGLDFWLITLACVAGAVLGCAFIIPLRKQMIDIDRLRFPSPTGVAVILKSPGAGVAKSLVLMAGVVLSMLLYLPSGLPAISLPASPEKLDALVAGERISQDQAEQTRRIARWIEQRSVPEAVLARGRALAELERLRESDASPQELAAQRARVQQAPGPDWVSDKLALAAWRAHEGQAPWDSLRSVRLGWAGDPLPGYADLGWRLPAKTTEDGQELAVAVDRDRNGRPDLLMTDTTLDVGRLLGLPGQFQLVLALAPFAIGAGFITGRAGLMVLAGGVLAYLVLNPLAYAMGWVPESVPAHAAPQAAFLSFNRPLGIGLLLGGALMGVVFALPAIREAIKSIAKASLGASAVGRDELGLKVLVVAVLSALLLLFLAADFVGNTPVNRVDPVLGVPLAGGQAGDASADGPAQGDQAPAGSLKGLPTASYMGYTLAFANEQSLQTWTERYDEDQRRAFMASQDLRPGLLAGLNPHLRALVIALVGAAWIWFAGIIIAQCTGMTDWSPISGMALLTVVLVLVLAGSGAVVGAVLLGAALCVAITCAADMMGDLKTGYLVGSQPRKQQIVELVATGLGPVICMLVLAVIISVNLNATGVPIGPGTPTPAPQAQALESVIVGVQGGQMPYALYGIGAVLGALLGLGVFPGLGVLIGLSMYLPFAYIATYGIGCVLNMLVVKIKGKRWAEDWGVPFAAGLLVGEALLALVINLVVLAMG